MLLLFSLAWINPKIFICCEPLLRHAFITRQLRVDTYKLWKYLNFFLIEKKGCDLTQMKAKHAACLIWRRFSNLFETTQSLFWAVFGLVSLTDFELAGENNHYNYIATNKTKFRDQRVH